MPRRLQFLLGNYEVKCLQNTSSIALSDDNQICCRWPGTLSPCIRAAAVLVQYMLRMHVYQSL